jgi:hypothetical protein
MERQPHCRWQRFELQPGVDGLRPAIMSKQPTQTFRTENIMSHPQNLQISMNDLACPPAGNVVWNGEVQQGSATRASGRT